MQTQLFTDDICARKHKGSITSIAANKRAMKRIERKVVPYNSEPIVHKDTKTYPTMAVSENYFRG